MSNNSFNAAANSPTQANAQKVAGTVSDIARGNINNVLQADGSIQQRERLFTARARYGSAESMYADGVGTDQGGNRGNWAYIKLLSSDTQSKEYSSGSSKRDISPTNTDLIGPESEVSRMANRSMSSTGYDKFLITGVSCDMSEKVQITEVFGDGEVVYYFGRQPLIFNIRGVLIDSPDNNWFVTWIKMYSEFLRGTQLAKNYELIKIVLPNMVITGTISGFSWQQDSNRDVDIPFAFQFIAKIVEPTRVPSGPMVNTNNIRGVDFSKVKAFTSQKDINSLRGQVASLDGVLNDYRSSLRNKGAALSSLGTGVGGQFGTFLESSKGTLNGYQSNIEGWTKQQDNYFNKVKTSALFQTVTSSLNGIRTNLFSPIYGILSSLTKLVSNAFNSANSIFNSLINPVRAILRDITAISKQAIAVVNLVNNQIKGLGRNVTGQLKGVESDFKTAIKTLGKAAGVIASAPMTTTQSIKLMFSDGYINSNSAFLKLSPKPVFVRPSLSVLKQPVPSRVSILIDAPEFTPKAADSL